MPKVLLTRPIERIKDSTFSDLLRHEGIDVIEIPMITISYPKQSEELDAALIKLSEGKFEYCVLASPTAAEYFQARVERLGISESIKQKVGFATVGAKSAATIAEFGYDVTVPLPPQNAGAAALLLSLRTFDIRGKRTLILQSQIGMAVLVRAFEMCGAVIDRKVLYETSGPTLHDSARLMQLMEAEERLGAITFFSPSAVEYFVRTLAQMGVHHLSALPALAAIGETTAKEIELLLRRRPDIVARKANQESLAYDIIEYLHVHK